MIQVDIAPTLALLFGVPIPKNNVGVLISGTFESFTGSLSLSLSLLLQKEKRF
jgi:ethanolaminephosphotransferase